MRIVVLPSKRSFANSSRDKINLASFGNVVPHVRRHHFRAGATTVTFPSRSGARCKRRLLPGDPTSGQATRTGPGAAPCLGRNEQEQGQ